MTFSLDVFWEDTMKVRYPHLKRWDVIRDQSHVHHTLVTILLFGTLGMVAAVLLRAPLVFVLTRGLASGILGGLCGYLMREVWSRLSGHERKINELWDGALDVLFPILVTLPWALSAYLSDVPTWTGAMLYLGAALTAWMYSFGRPDHALHYDWSQDPV